MRLLLKDLAPGKTYDLQFRSVAPDGTFSKWSRTFTLTATSDTLAPKTPTGLAVVSVGNSFRASWNEVTQSSDNSPANDLRAYLVKVTSSLAPGLERVYSTPNLNFELTYEMNADIFGSPRGSVSMQVAAIDLTSNTSAYSSVVSATNPAPAAVTGLTASPAVDSVNLSWDANSELDIKGYEVWLSKTGSGGTYSKVYSGLSTSFVHRSIDYLTDHWYRVYAVDVFDTKSTATTTASAVRPTGSFAIDSTPPSVPTGLTATLTTTTDTTTSAAVSWTAVADPDNDLAGYRIGYRPAGASDWSYTDVDYTLTSTRIDRLTPYVNYEFRIRSYDWSANLSAWSSTFTATGATNAAPAAPTGVAFSGGMQTATITWNENSELDIKNYEVQLDTANTFATGNLKTIKTNGTVISFSNLTSGTTYYARVRAVDNLGLAGSYSSIVSGSVGTVTASVTDGSAPASSPTPSVTGGVGFLWISWTPVANNDPTTYEVHMSTTTGFTPSGPTKLGEVSGSSFIAKNTAAGAALAYGTTYFVKLIAKDRDGAAAAGAQGSGSMVQVNTPDIAANSITAASAILANASVGTANIIDANITNAKIADLAVTNAKIGNLAVDTAKIADVAITNAKIANLAVDTAKIADLAVTNAKINSLSVTKLEAGTGLVTDFTVKSTLTLGDASNDGVIKSFDWASLATGWKLSKTGGLEINNGSVAAGALRIQDSDNIMLPEYAGFEFTTTFYTSTKIPNPAFATSSIVNTGGKFGPQFLRYTSTGAGANLATLSSDATTYNINVESGETYILSGYIKGSAAFANATIRFKASNGTTFASSAATVTSTFGRVSVAFTAPTAAGLVQFSFDSTAASQTFDVDGIQLERKVGGLTTPSPWTAPGVTSIDGGIIRTGEIRSTATVNVLGTDFPAWSINMAGNAQLGDALVRGKLLVGLPGDPDSGMSYISSGNFFSGVQGWMIDSSGNVEFNDGVFRGNLVGNTITGAAIYGALISNTSNTNADRFSLDSGGFRIIEGIKTNKLKTPIFTNLTAGTTSIPNWTVTNGTMEVRDIPTEPSVDPTVDTDKQIVITPSNSSAAIRYALDFTPNLSNELWFGFTPLLKSTTSFSTTGGSTEFGAGLKIDDFKLIEGGGANRVLTATAGGGMFYTWNYDLNPNVSDYVFVRRTSTGGTYPSKTDYPYAERSAVGKFNIPSDWFASGTILQLPGAAYQYNPATSTWSYVSSARVGYTRVFLMEDEGFGRYFTPTWTGTPYNSYSTSSSTRTTFSLYSDSTLLNNLDNIGSLSIVDNFGRGVGYLTSGGGVSPEIRLTGRQVTVDGLNRTGLYGGSSSLVITSEGSTLTTPSLSISGAVSIGGQVSVPTNNLIVGDANATTQYGLRIRRFNSSDSASYELRQYLINFTQSGWANVLFKSGAEVSRMELLEDRLNVSTSITSTAMRSATFDWTSSTATINPTSTTAVSMGTSGGAGTFVAPYSGRVVVHCNGQAKTGTAGQYVAIGYEIRLTNVSGAVVQAFNVNSAFLNYNTQYLAGGYSELVTGLTPGQTYYIRNMTASGASNAANLVLRGRLVVTPSP